MTKIFIEIQAAAKFAVAIITLILASGAVLIPEPYAGYVQLAVGVLGAIAVYAVPNVPKAAK